MIIKYENKEYRIYDRDIIIQICSLDDFSGSPSENDKGNLKYIKENLQISNITPTQTNLDGLEIL